MDQDTLTRIDEALSAIRLKRGVDYAYTVKYGKVHLLVNAIFAQPVHKVFDRFAVQVHTTHTYT